MNTSTAVWGKFTRGLLARQSINEEKLTEEGQWSNKHIILGIEFEADSLQVRLPDAKIGGARILFDGLLENNGPIILCVEVLQHVRGIMEHFKSVNAIWPMLTAPIDTLMSFGDERDNYVFMSG